SGCDQTWAGLYDSVTYLRQEEYVKGWGTCVTANLLVHRSVFEYVGPFDQAFDEAAFEDHEWSLRARRLGIPIVFSNDTVIDHPCMARIHQIKEKAERLARGELLMQQKLGRVISAPTLFSTLRTQLRHTTSGRLSLTNRMRIICVGMATGFWWWRAY